MIKAGMLDVLFGNEQEIRHLTGCEDLADSIAALSGDLETMVITRGAEGAIAVEGQERIAIPAARVERIVDTTGAGDLFAAGFLAARCRGRGLSACLQSGAIAAAEVISHFGARPEANLKELTGL
jgi:sugar/nucleoside kinase (ribokinase family)